MLETLDLTLKLGKTKYRDAMSLLAYDLQALQRAAFEHGVPVVVVLEGLESAGKGDSIAHLVEHMDPRGFKVHGIRRATEEEAMRPMLWRFWRRLPPQGGIAIFDRSWYSILVDDRLDRKLSRRAWEQELEEVNAFERQLIDEGTLILKLWLHISRKEQKRRFKAWARDESQRWRVQEDNLKKHRLYDDYLRHAEDLLARSHTHGAPWHLVAAEEERYRRVKVLGIFAEELRRLLEGRGIKIPDAEQFRRDTSERKPAKSLAHKDPLKEAPAMALDSLLARVDNTLKLSRSKYQRQLDEAQKRLRELQFTCYAKRRAAVLVFEGWDAAGKGGAIKRLTENLDPRGYTVIPIAKPAGEEARQHYLWRFWNQVPKDGHLAIFDRSWYGRVLVERIEGFCAEDQWRRAFQEINEFEMTLADHGIVICKFWLHITPEEQLRRFERRMRIPAKQYKITDEDWRNRAKWQSYADAVSDMLRQTSTSHAPWTVVEANDKLWARVKVIQTVVDALDRVLNESGGKTRRSRG